MQEDDALEMSEGTSTMVDFTNVEDNKFEILPKGPQNCTIIANEFKYSAKGNAMWAMQLEVNEGDYEGRRLFFHITFSEKAMGFAKESLQNLGRGDLLEGGQFDCADPEVVASFENLAVTANVTVGTYNGDATNNVRKVILQADLI